MEQLTIEELAQRNPEAAQKAHRKWVEHYDWMPEWVIEDFREHLLNDHGINMEEPYYSLGYSQSDFASFSGSTDLATFMQKHGYDLKYPAIYVDVQAYSARVRFDGSRSGRGWGGVSIDYALGNSYPSGVFADLSTEAWDELIHDLWCNGAEEEIETDLRDLHKDLGRELYDMLRDAYEFDIEWDQFVECCMCNEYLFNEDGEMV